MVRLPNRKTASFHVILPTLGLLLAGACVSEDPDVAKQRYFESGNDYFAQGLYRESIIEYRNAIQHDNRFGAARKQLASALLQVGNLESALGQQIRAADLLPDDAEAQTDAAALLLATRRFEDAETRVRRALAIDPSNVAARIILGNALAGLRDLDAAVAQRVQRFHLGTFATFARDDASREEVRHVRSKNERADSRIAFVLRSIGGALYRKINNQSW